MANKQTNLADNALITFDNMRDAAADAFIPTVRLGVTGLSRAGKTVFITALVHNLLHGGRLPLFKTYAQGRLIGGKLSEQPDATVPRFGYEDHIKKLTDSSPSWPDSTNQVSELRLTLRFQSATFLGNLVGPGKMHIDIIDYPGEWLLDLPLLSKNYADWSQESIELAQKGTRSALSKSWLGRLDDADPGHPAENTVVEHLSASFATYLRNCKEEGLALSTLSPGRFLMPGELKGSPALTFSPLQLQSGKRALNGSLHKLMEQRYEAYKSKIVKPFFRNYFARLDRQIVLVDVLRALNRGPEALQDLELALADILTSFKPGKNSFLSKIVTRRIDRILFAATKADHIHHSAHDQLEHILNRLVRNAASRAKFSGAQTRSLAISSVRATREGVVKQRSKPLDCIIGRPLSGEQLGKRTFDGTEEIALFPGKLPDNSESLFEGSKPNISFLRFTPPPLESSEDGLSLALPHIRLDRALDFLLSDKLA